MTMGRDYVPKLRPITGLLLIPRVIYEYGKPRWNDTDRENRLTRGKTYPSATLSTTNPTWTDPGANLDLRRIFDLNYVFDCDDYNIIKIKML
jgi:hypothetical protein